MEHFAYILFGLTHQLELSLHYKNIFISLDIYLKPLYNKDGGKKKKYICKKLIAYKRKENKKKNPYK